MNDDCTVRMTCGGDSEITEEDVSCQESATCMVNPDTGLRDCVCNKGYDGDGITTCTGTVQI